MNIEKLIQDLKQARQAYQHPWTQKAKINSDLQKAQGKVIQLSGDLDDANKELVHAVTTPNEPKIMATIEKAHAELLTAKRRVKAIEDLQATFSEEVDVYTLQQNLASATSALLRGLEQHELETAMPEIMKGLVRAFSVRHMNPGGWSEWIDSMLPPPPAADVLEAKEKLTNHYQMTF